jgi:hypothetical protein
MSVGIRVFEMAAVGRLSIRPSRLASEDLPELDSPQMARRSGRARRCCVRRRARTAGNSFEPGGIVLSSMACASFSSVTIRPVSGWSDTTGTRLELQTFGLAGCQELSSGVDAHYRSVRVRSDPCLRELTQSDQHATRAAGSVARHFFVTSALPLGAGAASRLGAAAGAGGPTGAAAGVTLIAGFGTP